MFCKMQLFLVKACLDWLEMCHSCNSKLMVSRCKSCWVPSRLALEEAVQRVSVVRISDILVTRGYVYKRSILSNARTQIFCPGNEVSTSRKTTECCMCEFHTKCMFLHMGRTCRRLRRESALVAYVPSWSHVAMLNE